MTEPLDMEDAISYYESEGYGRGWDRGRDAERKRVLAWLDKRISEREADGSEFDLVARVALQDLRERVESGEEAPK